MVALIHHAIESSIMFLTPPTSMAPKLINSSLARAFWQNLKILHQSLDSSHLARGKLHTSAQSKQLEIERRMRLNEALKKKLKSQPRKVKFEDEWDLEYEEVIVQVEDPQVQAHPTIRVDMDENCIEEDQLILIEGPVNE
ncbi:hypothetical protein LguiB_013163 [Lonicera macranthoides]